MGYFEGLTNASFKKDRSDTTVFYPFGALGRGRVVPDQDTEARIRTFIARFYKTSFLSMFAVGLFVGRVWVMVLLPILCGWFYFGSSSLTRSLPYSEEKLTLKESYTNSAAGHNKSTLVILVIFSILFVACLKEMMAA